MQDQAERGSTGGSLKTSLGIVGTGAALLFGAVGVGVLMCGGGFGSQVLLRLPEIVFAPEPVMIPATDPRLPKVQQRSTQPVANRPAPRVERWPDADPVFRDPPRWTEPGPESTPEPVGPLPGAMLTPVEPLVLQPAPVQPMPMAPPSIGPAPSVGPVATVSVSGDAASIVARAADGQRIQLPGAVPPGTYDLVVTFAGREPFAATTLLVLDASPRSVVCRSSLGICKVR